MTLDSVKTSWMSIMSLAVQASWSYFSFWNSVILFAQMLNGNNPTLPKWFRKAWSCAHCPRLQQYFVECLLCCISPEELLFSNVALASRTNGSKIRRRVLFSYLLLLHYSMSTGHLLHLFTDLWSNRNSYTQCTEKYFWFHSWNFHNRTHLLHLSEKMVTVCAWTLQSCLMLSFIQWWKLLHDCFFSHNCLTDSIHSVSFRHSGHHRHALLSLCSKFPRVLF